MKAPPLGPGRAGHPPGPGRTRPRSEHGEITWVGLVLLAAVAGGAYLGWTWIPVYFDHYTVKQVVRDYMNQAVKNPDDAGLRRMMVHKIRSLREVDSVDAWGRPVRLPSVPLDEGAVTWERDARTPPGTLHVAFDYERQVEYPLLRRTATKVFTVDVTGDLAQPDWGPTR
jgi:hypothetical protein